MPSDSTESRALIDRHPWFPFVLAFLLLIGAWSTMIVIAVKNRVDEVPLEHVQKSESPAAPAGVTQ